MRRAIHSEPRELNRPPSLVLGRKDPLGRLRGRESDSHIVSLSGDEEKIDYLFNRQRDLMPFRKELEPSNLALN